MNIVVVIFQSWRVIFLFIQLSILDFSMMDGSFVSKFLSIFSSTDLECYSKYLAIGLLLTVKYHICAVFETPLWFLRHWKNKFVRAEFYLRPNINLVGFFLCSCI